MSGEDGTINHYDPEGVLFWEEGRKLKLLVEGPYKDWVCYKHPDGQWVTLRKATREDQLRSDMGQQEQERQQEGGE